MMSTKKHGATGKKKTFSREIEGFMVLHTCKFGISMEHKVVHHRRGVLFKPKKIFTYLPTRMVVRPDVSCDPPALNRVVSISLVKTHAHSRLTVCRRNQLICFRHNSSELDSTLWASCDESAQGNLSEGKLSTVIRLVHAQKQEGCVTLPKFRLRTNQRCRLA